MYNQRMKVFLVAVIFIATFFLSFLFWPEFGYKIGCGPDTGDPLAGCAALRVVDYSDWRLHGGITWLQWENRDEITGEPRIETLGEPEQYYTHEAGMFLGSLGIAGAIAGLSYYLMSRKSKVALIR